MKTAVITGRGDLDDQRWLDQQVTMLRDGIEAAHDIWLNWTDNRNVSRFCDGLTYGEFIHREVPQLGPDDVPRLAAAVPEMSSREIAKATGVSQSTAQRAKAEVSQSDSPDAKPAHVIGADGKSYPGRIVGTTTAEVIEPDPELPRGRTTKVIKRPSWWRAVSTWLHRVRPEDKRFLSELLAAVQDAISEIEKGEK